MKLGTAVHRGMVFYVVLAALKILALSLLFVAWLALETHRGRGLCALSAFDCSPAKVQGVKL